MLHRAGPGLWAAHNVASLATAIDTVAGRLRIDWTRLRAFADWACQHPGGVPAAISDPPAGTGTALEPWEPPALLE